MKNFSFDDIKKSACAHLNPHLFEEDARETKKSKYNNKKTVLDGHEFDSKKEATRYFNLKLKFLGGHITDLQVQVEFQLSTCKYIADFTYYENGEYVVEDVKSKATMTAIYRLKKKIMLEEKGVEIKEV
jgi:hypothetical protein